MGNQNSQKNWTLSSLEIPSDRTALKYFFFFLVRVVGGSGGRGELCSRMIGFEGNFEKVPSPLSKIPGCTRPAPLRGFSRTERPKRAQPGSASPAEGKRSLCCVRAQSESSAERLVSPAPQWASCFEGPKSLSPTGRDRRRKRSLDFQQDSG